MKKYTSPPLPRNQTHSRRTRTAQSYRARGKSSIPSTHARALDFSRTWLATHMCIYTLYVNAQKRQHASRNLRREGIGRYRKVRIVYDFLFLSLSLGEWRRCGVRGTHSKAAVTFRVRSVSVFCARAPSINALAALFALFKAHVQSASSPVYRPLSPSLVGMCVYIYIHFVSPLFFRILRLSRSPYLSLCCARSRQCRLYLASFSLPFTLLRLFCSFFPSSRKRPRVYIASLSFSLRVFRRNTINHFSLAGVTPPRGTPTRHLLLLFLRALRRCCCWRAGIPGEREAGRAAQYSSRAQMLRGVHIAARNAI